MFHSEQAPWHRLDEIFLRLTSKAKEIIRVVTGNLPLIIPEAVSSSVISLTRYGLCTQASTPTLADPVPIKCNNGELKWDSENQRIYVDGTPEVLTVSGPNLLNSTTNITGKYITASGSISNGDDAQYTDLIPVKAGETYAASLVSGRNIGNNRWHGYDENGGWVKQIANISANGQQGNKLSMTATIDSGISYVRLSYGITDTEAMLLGVGAMASKNWEGYYPIINYSKSKAGIDTSTVIQSPYTTPRQYRGPSVLCEVEQGKIYYVKSTITADNDFIMQATFYASKDDVTDSANAIGKKNIMRPVDAFEPVSGAAYAAISCCTGDGVTFTFDSNSIKVYYTDADYQPYVAPQTASVPMLLSVDDVKDEVELISGAYTHRCAACEYDGTQNVGDTYLSTTGGKDIGAIIVYPLAEPTTESVTPQPLTLAEGTNIIDATANVEPLTAECEYQAVSALDILSTLLGTRSGTEDMSIKDAKSIVNVILGDDNK